MNKEKLMAHHTAASLVDRIEVSSLDAARSHLNTAIELWFTDKDPIAIHTLAVSAYEAIHVLNSRAKGPPLLYDNPGIPHGERNKMIAIFKDAVGFFKHADGRRQNKARASIDFDPQSSEVFMFLAIMGLHYLEVPLSHPETAFKIWESLHRSYFFGDDFLSEMRQQMSIESFRGLKKMGKKRFFDFMTKASRRASLRAKRAS
jgi:hypothetical protein